MSRKVDAHQLFLLIQTEEVAPLFGVWNFGLGNFNFIRAGEQRLFRIEFRTVEILCVSNQHIGESLSIVVFVEICFTTHVRETVQCTCKGETFKCLAVERRQVDTLKQIENGCERTVVGALFDNGFNGCGRHTLDGGKTEANLPFLVCTEVGETLVDVGTKCGDAHRLTFVHQLGDFLDVVFASSHNRCHKFGRIMSLHVASLVSNP